MTFKFKALWKEITVSPSWSNDMSIQIELKPEVEAELKALAQKNGLPLSQYVQRILECACRDGLWNLL